MEKGQQELGLEGGVTKLTKENVLANFSKNRIGNDPAAFSLLYSNFDDDMARVEALKRLDSGSNENGLGFVAEALVYTCIERGALGKFHARGTNQYDDRIKKVDMVVEGGHLEPSLCTIDVTTSQSSLNLSSSFLDEKQIKLLATLEKKLSRITDHVNFLASIPSEEAIEISSWIQQGGLATPRTDSNKHYFDTAEKIMLLKYYKNPKGSVDEYKPRAVFSGPQSIISIDQVFVNQVFSTDGLHHKQAVENISNLIQVEVPLSIAMLKHYVEELAKKKIAEKKGEGTNLFFDSYRASCRAWEGVFSDGVYQVRIQRAIKACHANPALRAQLQYYQKVLQARFAPDLK